jgi:acyl-CoA synthetase (AMP-forming)/AMP-acid ligase II
MLRHRAAVDSERTAFVFLTGDDLQEARLTYGQLDREARSIAVALAKHNVSGQPVLLIEAPGLRFMAALFGCLYAGAVVWLQATRPAPGKEPRPQVVFYGLSRMPNR